MIVYRSTWELRVMRYLDENSNIIWWASEEVFITYLSPLDGLVHKYFPDFTFQVRQKNGLVVTYMWEIKPFKQTIKPESKRKTKRFLEECMTYSINLAKWEAAEKFCQEHHWKFDVITERDIFSG